MANKKIKILFILIPAIITLIALVHLFTEYYPLSFDYNADDMRKVAWDDLHENDKKGIISNSDLLYIKEVDKDGNETYVLNENVVNVDSVWKYSDVNEFRYEDIRWINNKEENPLVLYMKRNRPVVEVIFKTTMDPLLGPIRVYIDVKSREIIGYGVRL